MNEPTNKTMNTKSTKPRQNPITFSHCRVRKHRGSDWLGALDIQHDLHGIGGVGFQAGHDVVPLRVVDDRPHGYQDLLLPCLWVCVSSEMINAPSTTPFKLTDSREYTQNHTLQTIHTQ